MLTQPKIENFALGFDWTDAAYPGLISKIPVQLKMQLANLRNVIAQKGTYTPNEDYLYLRQNIAPELSPNFLLLIASGHMNLTVGTPITYALWNMPIFKFWSCLMPTGATYPINGIYIEGRTPNVPMPMVQGKAVDYLCITGQADIS